MNRFIESLENIIQQITLPKPNAIDFVEILLIAMVIYMLLLWCKATKAWALLRGLFVIGVGILMAYIFHMNTVLWIVKNASVVAITALIVVFQPELRQALETLGKTQFFVKIFNFQDKVNNSGDLTDESIAEIVKACYEMGRVKTGALIVVTRENKLHEFDRTGIEVDGVITSQLFINIFEKNTPLHDGAVIVRDGRIAYATCYLPLSDNMTLSKELGTRHRAGVGISEVSDSITVIVSEENGRVSVAIDGRIYRNVEQEVLRKKLELAKKVEDKPEEKKFLWWKQRRGNEGKN